MLNNFTKVTNFLELIKFRETFLTRHRFQSCSQIASFVLRNATNLVRGVQHRQADRDQLFDIWS